MLALCIENVLNNLKKEFLKTINFIDFWCPHTDSNREPIDYKSIALPIELWGLGDFFKVKYYKTQYKYTSIFILLIEKYDDKPQKQYLKYLNSPYYYSFLL